MNNSLLARAVDQYRCIDRLSAQIEQAVGRHNYEELTALLTEMDQLQTLVKAEDRALLDLLGRQRELGDSVELHDLLVVMERIQARNRRVLPQARSILVMQRHELQRLQQGNVALQGYRSVARPVGSRISSAS